MSGVVYIFAISTKNTTNFLAKDYLEETGWQVRENIYCLFCYDVFIIVALCSLRSRDRRETGEL